MNYLDFLMPITNDFSIVCPEDCNTAGTFGTIEDVDPECPPQPNRSEINYLYLMHPTLGVGPVDWTVAGVGGWADAIDNADAGDTKVKEIPVIGTKPEETRTEIVMTNLTKLDGVGTYQVELRVKSLPLQTYNFLRGFQCGTIKPKIWYTDLGGFMYGKNEGIQTSKFTVRFPHEAGEDAYTEAIIRAEWLAQTDPDRIDNPLA